jgi:hypothetical protein
MVLRPSNCRSGSGNVMEYARNRPLRQRQPGTEVSVRQHGSEYTSLDNFSSVHATNNQTELG